MAELVGAVSIIATLVYLAVQVRQNTRSATVATYDSVMSGFNGLNIEVLKDTELLSLFLRGSDDPRSLNELEGARFVLLLRCYANEWRKVLRLGEVGALDSSTWRRWAPDAARMFSSAGGQAFQRDNPFFKDVYEALREFEGSTDVEYRLRG